LLAVPMATCRPPTLSAMAGLPILDELMANAWPPLEAERQNGWRLRWAEGMTRRANSVLASGAADQIPELVQRSERFYRRRGALPAFQVSTASAPSSLTDYLTDHGYATTALTSVAQARTADVVSNAASADYSVMVSSHATDAWFNAYWSVESGRGRSPRHATVCRQTLLAPPLPTRFVAVGQGAETIAVGQIVIERGWAGVQCMATRSTHRRTGAAKLVLHHLALEAASAGADRMYLAVLADNPNAVGLYTSASFRETHEYRYLTAPR
jgi:GNAT superfamily N-acetyltransferase